MLEFIDGFKTKLLVMYKLHLTQLISHPQPLASANAARKVSVCLTIKHSDRYEVVKY